ncbi:MAG: YdcF family protein [Actinomycetota bacterium]
MRFVRNLLLVVLVVAVAYPLWLGLQVWQQSRRDENRSTDAIVVLGAAQYDGEPSPVFRARLDQGAYLYREGFSHIIIVTGGKQEGDRFTEAAAGRRYLEASGIPAADIFGEEHGRTTLESLRAVKRLADDNDIATVLLVSDPMHSERIKRIAGDLGFDEAYASPASYVELNRSRITKARELLHEVASLLAYELLRRG